jgi:hypothetical protein
MYKSKFNKIEMCFIRGAEESSCLEHLADCILILPRMIWPSYKYVRFDNNQDSDCKCGCEYIVIYVVYAICGVLYIICSILITPLLIIGLIMKSIVLYSDLNAKEYNIKKQKKILIKNSNLIQQIKYIEILVEEIIYDIQENEKYLLNEKSYFDRISNKTTDCSILVDNCPPSILEETTALLNKFEHVQRLSQTKMYKYQNTLVELQKQKLSKGNELIELENTYNKLLVDIDNFYKSY